MDQQLFEQARQRVLSGKHAAGGIGTLGEKAIHAVLKHYFDPYAGSHEQKIGRYVADIVGENGIIEIQTRDLYRLRAKLECFLQVTTVTVVHPLVRSRWIIRTDPVSGRLLSRRKSPRRENFYTAFHELYGIKPLLRAPNLRLCLPLLDVEELRTESGRKRRGRPVLQREPFPIALIDQLELNCPADYEKLLPSILPESFTSLDYAACAEVHLQTAQAALNVLSHVDAVRRVSKTGRYLLYEKSPTLSD